MYMEFYDITGANAQVKYENYVCFYEKKDVKTDEKLPKRIYANNILKVKDKIQSMRSELIALSICLLTVIFFFCYLCLFAFVVLIF